MSCSAGAKGYTVLFISAVVVISIRISIRVGIGICIGIRVAYTQNWLIMLRHVPRGAFYYRYGDFPYADGARSEGLMGAYALAHKAGDEEKIHLYEEALKRAAWATLHLCNTPESVYSIPRPDRAIGGIRFKHTRHWFRVDTIQHVAAFYLKFLPYWED